MTAGKGYRRTESKYKGVAHEMYVTYDLEQTTRGGHSAMYPKVKRVLSPATSRNGRQASSETSSVAKCAMCGSNTSRRARATAGRDIPPIGARRNTRQEQQASLVPRSGSPRWRRSRRPLAMSISTLTIPNCRRNIGMRCSTSDKPSRGSRLVRTAGAARFLLDPRPACVSVKGSFRHG
jgi:hypothetical protein